MRPTTPLFLSLLLAAACGGAPSEATPPADDSFELVSKVFEVDEIYKSMMGPRQGRNVRLDREAADELLWITGFRAVMVGEDGETPMPQEFMCHSNFDFKPDKEGTSLKKKTGLPRTLVSPRIFTLSQGQLEIDFPAGFGIPTRGNEPFFVQMQVLNLNEEGGGHRVRHKLNVEFERDDPGVPMKPLFVTSAYALVSLGGEAATWGYEQRTMIEHDEDVSCLPGQMASVDTLMEDEHGNRFSGHFIVPPGRHTYRTLVTDLMALPFDTTAHCIAVHLHPYAEKVTLRDVTDDTVVYESQARNFADKIGLAHVDSYSSVEGIPLYADHEYEIVAVYDNTSGTDQDSMAVLLIYALDKRFQKQFQG